MPTTHRDQNYHRDQVICNDGIVPAGEAIDVEARAGDLAPGTPDAGWLRLRSRDGYLLERKAEGGGVQAAENMAIRPASTHGYFGEGNHAFTTSVVFANLLFAAPFVVPFDIETSHATFRLSPGEAGKFVRFGLYDAEPDTGLPRNLLHEFGPEEITIGQHSLTWETTLKPGYYFWCWLTDNAGTAQYWVNNPAYMKHVFGVSANMGSLYVTIFYARAYALGLPATWRDGDEAITYFTTSSVAFGAIIA